MGSHALVNHAVQLVILAVSVLVASRIVPGIRVRSFGSALFFALIFAILDKLLFTLLVFLSFPFVLVTFGLFILVINAFLFWLTDKIVEGVEVDGWLSAFLGALVTSVINLVVLWFTGF
jgi:putative membrane protein